MRLIINGKELEFIILHMKMGGKEMELGNMNTKKNYSD